MHSSPVVTVAGAKGGVGKTTTSINLGVALADRDLDVVVLELDLAMANVVDFLSLPGGEEPPTTMHDVLAGEAAVTDALVPAPGGVSVVPSATALDKLGSLDVSTLPGVVDTLRDLFDVVLIDTAAGMNSATTTAVDVADYTVLVSTPRVASLRDADKTMTLVDKAGGEVLGMVLTMTGTGTAPESTDLAEFLDVDLLAAVPEDEAVPASQDAGVPVVDRKPDGPVAGAYREAAERMHERFDASGAEDAPATDATVPDRAAPEAARADPTAGTTRRARSVPEDARGGPAGREASSDMNTDDTTDESRAVTASDDGETDPARDADGVPEREVETDEMPSREDLEAQGWTFPQAEEASETVPEDEQAAGPTPDATPGEETRQATDGGSPQVPTDAGNGASATGPSPGVRTPDGPREPSSEHGVPGQPTPSEPTQSEPTPSESTPAEPTVGDLSDEQASEERPSGERAFDEQTADEQASEERASIDIEAAESTEGTIDTTDILKSAEKTDADDEDDGDDGSLSGRFSSLFGL